MRKRRSKCSRVCEHNAHAECGGHCEMVSCMQLGSQNERVEKIGNLKTVWGFWTQAEPVRWWWLISFSSASELREKNNNQFSLLESEKRDVGSLPGDTCGTWCRSWDRKWHRLILETEGLRLGFDSRVRRTLITEHVAWLLTLRQCSRVQKLFDYLWGRPGGGKWTELWLNGQKARLTLESIWEQPEERFQLSHSFI